MLEPVRVPLCLLSRLCAQPKNAQGGENLYVYVHVGGQMARFQGG